MDGEKTLPDEGVNVLPWVVVIPPLAVWGWQIFTYLKTAYWPPVSVLTALDWLEASVQHWWPGIIEILSLAPFTAVWLILGFFALVIFDGRA